MEPQIGGGRYVVFSCKRYVGAQMYIFSASRRVNEE